MTELWVCPFCKWENYSGRTGMKEPRCIRCGKERTTKEDAIKELDKQYDEWHTEMKDAVRQLEPIYEEICSLEDMLSELNLRRAELEEERDMAKEELQKIKNLIDESPSAHYIAKDQCSISHWVDVVGEDGAE